MVKVDIAELYKAIMHYTRDHDQSVERLVALVDLVANKMRD